MDSTLDQVKALAMAWLGPFYKPVSLMLHAAFPFLTPTNLNAIFIFSAVFIALMYYLRTARPGLHPSVRGFFRYLTPREIFLHRSAIVDYQFFIVNSALLAYVKLSATIFSLVGLFSIADIVRDILAAVFGSRVGSEEPTMVALMAYTIVTFVVVDFSKYLSHFLQHKVPVLWEFHKVHHSAEVLTLLTNYRLHPVDVVVDQTLSAIGSGLVVGLFSYFYPAGLAEITILNISVIYILFYLVANLRHSHIPVQYGWRTSHVLCSPYMHHIHHSVEERHWDKNFSLVLSAWDTLFGTAYVPRGLEMFRLGLPGEERHRFGSVLALYLVPFAGAVRRLCVHVGIPANRAKAD